MRPAAALLFLAGCGIQNPWQQQRSYAESLRPAEVAPKSAAPPSSLRLFRVRAYADDEYQAQTPRWNQHVAEQLDRASTVLETQFGVRLELESARPWKRAGSSAHLASVVEQLIALDKGEAVAWVIGFVSSQDVFSAAQDQLGLAQLFGRHIVLRGMFSAAEMDAINASLNLLSSKDREQLARDRRLHKETAVLLHEWAHSFGAIHDRSPQSLMAPAYDKSQAAFSDASARVIGIGLEFRDAPGSRDTWAKAYREQLTRPTNSFWDLAERDQALAVADQFFAGGAAAKPQVTPLPPEDAKRMEEVAAREKSGDYRRALQLLTPLIDRYPRSQQVQGLACALLEESGASPGSMREGCARAARLPDASAQVLLLTAQLQQGEGNSAEALPLLARAEGLVSPEPSAWLWLAQLQLAAGAISAAERAVARASGQKGAEQIAAACARTRWFVGFPKEPLPPEREAAYVATALAAHEQIDRRNPVGARERAAQLAKDFPGTPAAAVIECRARSRGKDVAAIRTACQAAADGAPGAFLPHYILGLVASAMARWTDADAAMRRALAIDGSTPEVWASLAAVQQRLRAADGLRDLKSRYRERFGATLAPALFPAGWAARPRL
jgi:tetratricopeptide (TPR) repeat protein